MLDKNLNFSLKLEILQGCSLLFVTETVLRVGEGLQKHFPIPKLKLL